MRNLILPAVLAAGLALGSAAFAATAAPHGPATAPAASHATVSKATVTKAKATTHASKQQACEATWKAQKTHTGGRTAFMKACVAKG